MKREHKFSLGYYMLVFFAIIMLESIFFSGTAVKEISYNRFRDLLTDNKIQSVILESNHIYGLKKAAKSDKQSAKKESPDFQPPRKKAPWNLDFGLISAKEQQRLKRQFVVTRLKDPQLVPDLQAHGVDYRGKIESHWLGNFVSNWIIPIALFILLGRFIARRMGKTAGGFLDVGKNKARIYAVDPSQKVTFNDVAGVDEAVEEVKEVVSFLKSPERYTRLGAKLPKGILLIGPPGTGKTLLARAVAGEAGVPFFNLSGSDFVEMFVGVGAARVRDLFKDAKAKAPCIIFIDELDAVGKNRSVNNVVGGNDERENTLNQLLTEMDGFDPQVGIIIMAATNRPEVLDRALLRPGRFDRQILVDRPDLGGRMAIFEVHTRELSLDPDVDFHRLAAETPGFAGAEIASVCNEAALLASRREQQSIFQNDFQDAIERVIAGLEKKNKLINPHEREVVAYHESGHAIVGHLTPGADPVQKVSIIPRGIGALGYTLQTPLEDRFLMSRNELLGKIKGLLGGRAAEELIFGDVSTGASNDLEKVAGIVRSMLTVYGMSKKMPNRSLVEKNASPLLGQGPTTQRRSETLETLLDDETQAIIDDAYQAARKILFEHRKELETMASLLLEKEKIDNQDILKILGPDREALKPVNEPPQRIAAQ